MGEIWGRYRSHVRHEQVLDALVQRRGGGKGAGDIDLGGAGVAGDRVRGGVGVRGEEEAREQATLTWVGQGWG